MHDRDQNYMLQGIIEMDEAYLDLKYEYERLQERYLKHRLTAYAKEYPELCRITEEAGDGCMSFEIDKHRCSIRLTAPYSEERKETARKLAKANGVHTRLRKEGTHE